jgi:hypothetical protein
MGVMPDTAPPELLTVEQCCDLYEEITGRRIQPGTWRGYVSRRPGWPQPEPKTFPRDRSLWDRAIVDAHLRQVAHGGEHHFVGFNQRAQNIPLLEELKTATGSTATTLYNAGITVLHDIWSIYRDGGTIWVQRPGSHELESWPANVPGVTLRPESE